MKPFALGLAVGVGWAIVHWAFGIPMPLAVAALVVFPACEEALKVGTLWWRRGALGSSQFVGVAFGAGFGVAELALRWWSAIGDTDASALSFVGPIVPLFLHAILGVIAWRIIGAGRPFIAFAGCLTLHILHNAFVTEILMKAGGKTDFVTIVWWQILVYCGVLLALMRKPSEMRSI